MELAILLVASATLLLTFITAFTSIVIWMIGIIKSKSKKRVEQVKKEIKELENMLANGVSDYERKSINKEIENLKSQIKD